MSAAENTAAARHLRPVEGGRTASDEGDEEGRVVLVEGGKARIQIGTAPDAIRTVRQALNLRVLPDTYVTAGTPVVLEEVSGSVPMEAGDKDALLPLAITPLRAPLLSSLLAEHTFTWRWVTEKTTDGKAVKVETSPTDRVLSAVLSRQTWPGLPVLISMIGAPVLRPDGSLLQAPGYDEATGLFLAPRVHVAPVPATPTPKQVAAARAWLLDSFLADFPWVSGADRANYLGLLFTPLLRPFTRCLTPFVIVDATTASSGKTILTAALGGIHGQRVMGWTDNEDELRKTITAVMRDSVGAVVFDNLEEGTVIKSAVLARLITEHTWSDRLLSTNSSVSFRNERVWLATGNNVRVGGDMASRTVWVHLDPDMPNPEQRAGFTIPNLDTWILESTNQAIVLHHLLVLVVDWINAGAPQATGLPPMRQFTRWAQHLGGLLEHHQVHGFLGNAATSRELDDEASEWRGFLLTWWQLHRDTRISAHDLRRTAEPEYGSDYDKWSGMFPTTPAGHLLTVKSLGRKLTGQIGRWRGDIVLRSVNDPHGHGRLYWVERQSKNVQPPKETAQTAKPQSQGSDLQEPP